MAEIVTRASWGAKVPSQPLTRLTATRGVKVHYTGGHVNPAIVDDHTRCVGLVRSVQRMHMAGGRETAYSDIGYNMVACPHGKVFVGRGPHMLPAANGAGLNTGHYAVLALLGSTGFTEPNDQLLHAIVDAIEHLRVHGDAGKEIRCHRDGYATECPGGPLTAWVRRGAPRPETTSPHASTSWTEDLVKDLPTLRPGDEHRHVKTMRCVLFARGYEPANLHSTEYGHDADDLADLKAKVNAFKTAHKLADDGVFGDGAWKAALT
ncbi:N-acetylmuramoyl-L-alanine amidase [Nonomuraea sp. K274]|uniref:N-acetylmuramoyl-L-alanine amidase n=1 Tax=Nonomuraea cypriaca TaxID=1187855 RepID=A0A931F3I0_9ACTN|nr:N-acetylmuramoyl-L-alanine amidase [Nonomuraea cypriaca]MBF8191647.1 N-acetylmuramoyl-L-alanine amidase [Nonomuraea cypriaca]